MNAREKNIEDKLWCMSRKIWAIIIYSLQAVILILMLGSFGSNRWVEQGTGDTKWTGGLLRVTTGFDWEEIEYIDMSKSCDLLEVTCDTFEALKSAGAAFCFFEVISYVFTIIWMVKMTFILVGVQRMERITPYLWPGVGLFTHILAEIIWSGVTKAKFDGSCSDISSSDLCSTQGPAIVLAVTCIYIATFVIFFIFYMKRFQVDEKEEEINDENKP